MKYMVAFHYRNGPCGNKTLDSLNEAYAFIRDNSYCWQSYSAYIYESHWSGVSHLEEIQPCSSCESTTAE